MRAHQRTTTDAEGIYLLRANGTSLVTDVHPLAGVRVLYWGPDLGPLTPQELRTLRTVMAPTVATNGVDQGVTIGVHPFHTTGWTGKPGLSGHRQGRDWSSRFKLEMVETIPDGFQFHLEDTHTSVTLVDEIRLLTSGLVKIRASIRNRSSTPYALESLTTVLPVPERADEIVDFAGRWAKERIQQRLPFSVGTHVREGRKGRTGADASVIMAIGEPGFDTERGHVWATHVAFSGNHLTYAERNYAGERLLGGGELLLPGEIILDRDQVYHSPWVYFARGDGLDDVAAQFHAYLRSRAIAAPTPPPVTLNVWEAVYFDHDPQKLTALAERAASIGVERFVLDDGWFADRRDDSKGLGDWYISPQVWGEGRLRALADHVHQLGMEFGLWFEPEMINRDSNLAREHPDWILRVPGRYPLEARNQQVLDLTQPSVQDYLRERIVTLVHEIGVDYIKWDHNRDLVEAGDPQTGQPLVHQQTTAFYSLVDTIREACPGLQIESCSSGGARIDLEVLERTDRVWASDCIDAHDRVDIQWGTLQLCPPELIGSHIGAEQAHTTGRKLDLTFRAAVSLVASMGIEWNLFDANDDDLHTLADWIAIYRSLAPLISTGRVYRRRHGEGSMRIIGVVAPDHRRAIYTFFQLDRPRTWPLGPVPLPGLDPQKHYRIRSLYPPNSLDIRAEPPWWGSTQELPGSVLTHSGIQVPALHPDHAALVEVEEVTEEQKAE